MLLRQSIADICLQDMKHSSNQHDCKNVTLSLQDNTVEMAPCMDFSGEGIPEKTVQQYEPGRLCVELTSLIVDTKFVNPVPVMPVTGKVLPLNFSQIQFDSCCE